MQTYVKTLYHVVFSTKYRTRCIDDEMLNQISFFINEKLIELNVRCYILNGYLDHVHLLISIPPHLSVSEVVRQIKGYSSFYIPGFSWQKGYAVFTVDELSFERILNYIKKQKEHHRGNALYRRLLIDNQGF